MKIPRFMHCVFSLVFSTVCIADIVKVPEDHAMIQDAIDAAQRGDTVLVQPGTYNEHINFNGKSLSLFSMFTLTGDTAFIRTTLIEGNRNEDVVTFSGGEDSTTVLCGFTVQKGEDGIYCDEGSGPSLRNLVIRDTDDDGLVSVNGTCSMRDIIIQKNRDRGIRFYDGEHVLEYVTIQNQGDGGLYASRTKLTMTHSHIMKNGRDSYGFSGMLIRDGEAHLEDVVISENNGIGIMCTDSAFVRSDSLRIMDNTAERGGGLYVCEGSSVVADGLLISGNRAEDKGGGIYVNAADVTINRGVIAENTAHEGGGVYSVNAEPEFSGVTIRENTATDGGGLYLADSHPRLSATEKSNVYSNGAEIGRDLYSMNASVYTVIVDTFTVKVPTEAHAFPIDGYSFEIQHGLIDQLSSVVYVSPNGSDENDGSSMDSPVRTIAHALEGIVANSEQPGVIHLAPGRYSPSSTAEVFPLRWVSHVTMSGDTSDAVILDGEGETGVIELIEDRNVVIENIRIVNGLADRGGGIYGANSEFAVRNLLLEKNSSYQTGGGMYCYQSELSGSGLTLLSNESAQVGGGIYFLESVIDIEDTVVRGNVSDVGGGVGVRDSDISLRSCRITENTAYSVGGGIYSTGLPEIRLDRVVVAGNRAEGVRGGGIYARDAKPVLLNVTVADNVSNEGGGAYLKNCDSRIVNSIFWNNEADQIRIIQTVDSLRTVIGFSDVEGGQTGLSSDSESELYWLEGNIDDKPGFATGDSPSYDLSASSPCIDAGTTFFVWEGDTLIDLQASDYVGQGPDMGAVEYGEAISPPEIIPEMFMLYQNYPNPFNDWTVIGYDLPEDCEVSLILYDLLGREIAKLVERARPAGHYDYRLSGLEAGSGVYFYRLRAGGFSNVKKFILTR